jgi:translation elongation factor EF-G
VDKKDAFLDTYALERARGITIFSKQAVFSLGDTSVTLLDTPGHVDFSAEMERTLQVLDYAILVINGADGVQGHTETLWRLLKRYHIPVFLFVNKMDQPGTDKEVLLANLRRRLDGAVVDFGSVAIDGSSGTLMYTGEEDPEAFYEELAMCDENIMESYLETMELEAVQVRRAIQERKIFPCYFGSALKLTGVEEFLKGVETWAETPNYPEAFGAKVFKISRDEQGNRLTHMKITGGSLKVKTVISEDNPSEKINELRGLVKSWNTSKATDCFVSYIKGLAAYKVGDTEEAIYNFRCAREIGEKTELADLADNYLTLIRLEND